uniref:Uncharacterized protein n=1 Tax=Anguilla anguilla TaxID=7936 RepID=A0A0E9RQ42_ANGAN
MRPEPEGSIIPVQHLFSMSCTEQPMGCVTKASERRSLLQRHIK